MITVTDLSARIGRATSLETFLFIGISNFVARFLLRSRPMISSLVKIVRYDMRYGPSSVLLPSSRTFVEIQPRNSPYARLAYFTIFCFVKLPRYRLSCESGAILSMLQIRRRSFRRRSSSRERNINFFLPLG